MELPEISCFEQGECFLWQAIENYFLLVYNRNNEESTPSTDVRYKDFAIYKLTE